MKSSSSRDDCILFPSAANQRLVDYYVKDSTTGLEFPVSAKAGLGAAPSLSSVWDIIKDKRPKKRELQNIWDFLEVMAGRISKGRSISVIETLLEGPKKYNSKAYLIVKEAIFNNKDFTVQDIQYWAEQFKDGVAVHDFLQRTLYSNPRLPKPRTTSAEMISEVLSRNKSDGLSSKTTKAGIILSPMAYSLMDELNNDEAYTKYLTEALNSLSIDQVNLYLTKKAFRYTISQFQKADWRYEYHSNAGDPAGNAFGFKKR
jgi:hypothetical protein